MKTIPPFLAEARTRHAVFLLGAGASKDAGLPLAKDLLDAEYLATLKAKFPVVDSIDTLVSWCERLREFDMPFEELLMHAHRSENQDLRGELTSYYTSVLYWAETYAGTGITKEQLATRSDLEASFEDWVFKDTGYHIIFDYILRSWFADAVVITFNHDLMLEYAAFRSGGVSYGQLMNHVTPESKGTWFGKGSGYRMLKLHGSFNLLQCPSCRRFDVYGDNVWSSKEDCAECGCRMRPVFVPPVTEKEVESSPLAVIWKEARDALEQCRLFVVIGYSFPHYDQAALELLWLSLASDAIVVVIDPSGTPEPIRRLPGTSYLCQTGFRDLLQTWGYDRLHFWSMASPIRNG